MPKVLNTKGALAPGILVATPPSATFQPPKASFPATSDFFSTLETVSSAGNNQSTAEARNRQS
jgi:hypothetical protein